MTVLTFDEARHEYRLDGVRLPSVTQVIDFLSDYSRVPPDVLERARLLGDAVHIATMLDDTDDLVEESVHTEVMPYLEAWRRFRADTGFMTTLIEYRVHSHRYGYAGTLDRVGSLQTGKFALLDLKTTAQLMPSTGPQTAAYKQALIEMNCPYATSMPRYVLLLQPDKKPPYRLEPCDDPSDLSTFLSALHLHKWRASYCKP